MEGTIKTFDSIRKFGHIEYDGGKDIFVNIRNFVSHLSDDEIKGLVGKAVTFAVGSFTNQYGITRPTAVKVELKKEEKEGFDIPEADASTDELIPYEEQQRIERKQTRAKYAECYVGKHESRKAKALRIKKIEKDFDDFFDDAD